VLSVTRFLFYSHDSYGLGHFRRSSSLASALVGSDSRHEVLIVTGSPRAQSFRLPDGVDTIKLPTATKDGNGSYQPRKLRCDMVELTRLRSTLINAAAMAYDPEVVVVDHSPTGMAGELIPLLDRYVAESRRPRLVLGARDIIDDAEVVGATWTRDGVWEYVDAYDQVLVYGDNRIVTTAEELALDSRGTLSVAYTGYLAPSMPDPIGGDPYLLVTAGGGGDGQSLIRAYLHAVEAGALGDLRSKIVTGPLMSSGRQAELFVKAEALANVEIQEFSDNMRSLISSAAGVISMGGYNTVVEELASEVPTLIVPRCFPRQEQRIRAERLAEHGDIDWALVEDLTPARVDQFVRDCLEVPRRRATLDLCGLDRAAQLLSEIPVGHV